LTHFSEKRVSVPVPLTHFRHPIIVCVLAYGLISANMTPILFTRGDIGAGRMQSIVWAQYILLLVLAVFYVLGHAAGRLESVKKRFFKNFEEAAMKARLLRGYVAVVLVLFVAGSALSLGVNSHFYSSASAATDLVNGNAVRYRTESEERLNVLLTDDKNPVIPAYTARPELLFFSDITPDETEWINTAMAEYYHKDTVRVGNE
ncbi:MAG: hypothetical protein IJR58_07695, partial [Lachnospiraceae bacterium]|nr:hypothetical protein [Lachnospiraceae bacterium]